MRLLSWLFLLPLALFAIGVAIANRGAVTVRLDPFSETDPAFQVEAPLFLVMFACVLIGLLVGGFTMWINQGRHRSRAWKEYRHARELERELAKRQEEESPQVS